MFKTVIPKFPVADVTRAVAFYKGKLGFEKLFDYGDYAAVARDALEIHLWECREPGIAENTACRAGVDDIEALYAEYRAAGVIHPNGLLEEKPWVVVNLSSSTWMAMGYLFSRRSSHA